MTVRQTRIFVPWAKPFDQGWKETLLGHVIAPLVRNHPPSWFWFSRYVSPADDSADCDLSKVDGRYYANGYHRSLRFRYGIEDSEQSAFEVEGSVLIQQAGCAISDWRDYDLVGDLGSDRFLGEGPSPNRRQERAERMLQVLQSTSDLVIDSLMGPDHDGRFRAETSSHSENPLGRSFLESVHHLFCNVTDAPLSVLVFSDGTQQSIGTDWALPLSVPPNPALRPIARVEVRY